MSRFINSTLVDMRKGRESWRVFLAVCSPAFDRWRVELYLERVTEPADDFIARGIRNRFDRESAR